MLPAGLPATTGWQPVLPRDTRESSFPVADHFAAHSPLIDAGQALFHRRCQQRNVRDFAEMFGNEPSRFVRGHPVQMIESREVHRAGQ